MTWTLVYKGTDLPVGRGSRVAAHGGRSVVVEVLRPPGKGDRYGRVSVTEPGTGVGDWVYPSVIGCEFVRS